MTFCHLHVHSEYSFLDGLARIEPLVHRTRDLGMSSIALTDHGGLWGIVPFYKTCLEAGIKPILGCEVYLVDNCLQKKGRETPYHLVLLAETNEGYKNLVKLVTKAQLKGFHYKPRLDKALLARYSSGLIALSGCSQGEIPHQLLAGKWEKAQDLAREYRDIFGPQNFFLELQDHGLSVEREVNSGLVELSKALGLGLVATNDVHYVDPSDGLAHQVLLSVQTQRDLDEALALPSKEYYLKTCEEMEKSFGQVPEAIENTVAIAHRCNVQLDLRGYHLPKTWVPPAFNPSTYLRKLTYEGAVKHWGDPLSTQVLARIEKELATIGDLGFCSYFLIVKDIVDYAKGENIPVGLGRGSGAGSIVCYCLGITGVDPLKYDLIFERFLNPERKSLPDIDIDLCHRGRKRVLHYLRTKYGEDHIAHVGAFSTLQARSVLRDTGRALKLPYHQIDKMCSLIPYSSISLEEASQIPSLDRLLKNNGAMAKAFKMAKNFQGLPRHMTQHSAGVVIAQGPLTDYLPLQRASGDEVITQGDMEILEDLGLVKIDLLGLRFLTALGDTLNMIKEYRKINMAPQDIPLDDGATWEALGKGETGGVFQLESSGMRSLLRRIKPRQIQELSAVIALYRPGPLASGETEEYIARRQGTAPVQYLHPRLEKVLSSTYGVFVYQEQIIQAVHQMAGLTLGEADLLRRTISQGHPPKISPLKDRFVQKAQKAGVDKSSAQKVFSALEAFGGYAFNKSHSISYALLAYQVAYLKTHFPQEYFAALLSLYMDSPSRLRLYITEARRLGLELLRPDINKSSKGFTPEGKDSLRTGLFLVKYLGAKGVKALLQERGTRPFTGFFDFCQRIPRRSINIKALKSLILAGAFDNYGLSRPALLLSLKSAASLNKNVLPGQLSLLPPLCPQEALAEKIELAQHSQEQKIAHELEGLGHYITAHPMELWESKATAIRTHTALELSDLDLKQSVTLVGMLMDTRWARTRQGARMIFLRLGDLTGDVEVVLFPRQLSRFRENISSSLPLVVQGFADLQDDGSRAVVAQRLSPLNRHPNQPLVATHHNFPPSGPRL